MMEEVVRAEVKNAVEIARSAFPQCNIPIPTIKFSNRMTSTGGTCGRRKSIWVVTFSLPIMRENDISKYCSQVVFHEVAHMVDRIVYGNWGHGETFYRVMKVTFGKRGKEAGRTHSFKTPPRRRNKTYQYTCTTCGEIFQLSAIRHSRAQKGIQSYNHGAGHPLKYAV